MTQSSAKSMLATTHSWGPCNMLRRIATLSSSRADVEQSVTINSVGTDRQQRPPGTSWWSACDILQVLPRGKHIFSEKELREQRMKNPSTPRCRLCSCYVPCFRPAITRPIKSIHLTSSGQTRMRSRAFGRSRPVRATFQGLRAFGNRALHRPPVSCIDWPRCPKVVKEIELEVERVERQQKVGASTRRCTHVDRVAERRCRHCLTSNSRIAGSL